MDNLAKYKLSQFKDIRTLNEEGTAILSYNISDDKAYVIKYTDIEKRPIYDKIKNIKCNNMPEIYEIIEDNDKCIIIEKYIKGFGLERLIKERGPLKEKTACKYILDICQALRAVHSLNIIHRDISPDNVIIDENDNAVLLDFDIAREGSKNKSTDTTILGTAGFASPEQYGFAQTDARSDIYSLGALFNYMLTGYIPQIGAYAEEPYYSVISKATKIDSSMRYGSVEKFESEISGLIKTKTPLNTDKNTEIKAQDIPQSKMERLGLNKVPGFRTDSEVKKFIAAMIYIIFFVAIFSAVAAGENPVAIVEYMSVNFMVMILPIWWFGNNGKQWDIIPGMSHLGKETKTVIAVIIYFTAVMIFVYIVPLPK